ncbi:MAG: hypothetical protein ACOY46_11820 [Bacillota bacterium]
MKSIIIIFEGLIKTLMGTEPVTLRLIYPELSKPEVHKISND